MRNFAVWMLGAALAGCGGPIDNGNDLASTPPDAAGAPDLAGCHPACGGLTPFCNATNHCVGCLKDTDCPTGSYCKIASDAIASCTPGCMADASCPNGQKCCGMRCVDTTSDPANCGGCGMACSGAHQRAACNASKCAPGACDVGWGDCNNDPKDGCEANLHADPKNCTACGMACNVKNAYAGCADGCYTAACKFGFDDCNNNPMDGCETSVISDPNNCGGCGKACKLANAMAACTAGNCTINSCNLGFADCNLAAADGCESNVATDGNNCGRCGNVCPQGQVCKQGGCTCPNCNIPNASAACVNNMCVFSSCNPGYADCNNNVADGCEVSLYTDKNNCGKCGNVCPVNMPGCSNGNCVPCGNDCWGPAGCLTAQGKCIQFTCRAGSAGANFCNGCLGWSEVTYDMWMNQGWCKDVIATYRVSQGTATHCGAQNLTCCKGGAANCGGGDNAWHFWNAQMNANYYTGPCIGCANDTNCTFWNNIDNSAYTRITVCTH